MADPKGTSNFDDCTKVCDTYQQNSEGRPRTFDAQFIAHTSRLSATTAKALLLMLDSADYGCKCEPAEEEAWEVKCLVCKAVEAVCALWPDAVTP